jgi:hypothetical protein
MKEAWIVTSNSLAIFSNHFKALPEPPPEVDYEVLLGVPLSITLVSSPFSLPICIWNATLFPALANIGF